MGDFGSAEHEETARTLVDPGNYFYGLSGEAGADASLEAARLQAETGREGIEVQRDFLDRMLSQTEPFQQFGLEQTDALSQMLEQGFDRSLLDRAEGMVGGQNQSMNRLNQLLNDPQAQASFIQDNPFFNQLAQDAENRIFQNAAARGKVGSGGTAEALQNSLVGIGSDLLNRERQQLASGAGLQNEFQIRDISNLINLSAQGNQLTQNQLGNLQQGVNVGLGAATGQGAGIQSTGNQITNLLTGIGNAQAAGGIGAANSMAQGSQNIAGLASAIGSFFGSDRIIKTDVQEVGEVKTDKGTYPTYLFRYVGSKLWVLGVMAQDVVKITPEAVVDFFGVMYVDYSRL